MRKATLAVVALAIVLVGCGGGSNKTGAQGTTSSTSSPAGEAAGGSSSGYCGLAKEYQSQSDEISKVFQSIDYSKPDTIQQQLADAYKKLAPKFRDAFAKALAVAPGDIKADVKLIGDGFSKFLDELEKVNYDFSKLGQNSTLTQFFQDPAFKAAVDRVGTYGADKCGIAYTPAPASS